MRLAVLLFEIVRAGIVVDVGAEVLSFAVKFKDWQGGIQQWLQGVIGGETTLVLGVVSQQSRSRRAHRRKMCVVNNGGQVARCLFGIAQVAEVSGAGAKAG